MLSAHAAVKHELLVRYLDAWAPAALHSNRRATYVDCSSTPDSSVAAARVFCEFADLLHKHTLTMVVTEPSAELTAAVAEGGSPPGLVVHPSASVPFGLESVSAAGAPVLGWFDGPDVPASDVASVVAIPHAEVLVCGSAPPLSGLVCRAELVDTGGAAELISFATRSEKALEKFKDELWRLDEYAGIRLRDPSDADGTLLDISERPNLAPLRRALLGEVTRVGELTLAELRVWTIHETVFRAVDATNAVHALVAAGSLARTPAGGRLSPATVLTPV